MKTIPWLVLLLGFSSLVIVSTLDFEDEKLEQKHYCKMVDLFKSSDGEQGWPDYKSVYGEQCVKDKKRS